MSRSGKIIGKRTVTDFLEVAENEFQTSCVQNARIVSDTAAAPAIANECGLGVDGVFGSL